MELNKKYKNLPEIALWGLLTVIISIIGLGFPVVFIFTAILSPIPIAIITFKYKEAYAGLISLAGLLILMIFFGVPYSIIQFLNYSIVGIIIGYVIRNKFSLKKSIVLGGTGFIVAFVLSNYIIELFFGIKIIQQFVINSAVGFFEGNKENLIKNFKVFIDTVKPKNVTPESLYMEARNSLNILLSQIPAFLIAATWVASFTAITIASYIIRKLGNKIAEVEPFSMLKMPFSLALIFVIIQLVADSNINNPNMGKTALILMNIAWIIGFCFMIQGAAIIDYWFIKLGLRGILKFIVYIIVGVIILPFAIVMNLPMFLIFLGMLDYLMDFRKLEAKKII